MIFLKEKFYLSNICSEKYLKENHQKNEQIATRTVPLQFKFFLCHRLQLIKKDLVVMSEFLLKDSNLIGRTEMPSVAKWGKKIPILVHE